MQSLAVRGFATITIAVLLFPAITEAQIRSLQVPAVSGRSYNTARFSPNGKWIAVAVNNDRGVLADASFAAAAVVGDVAESVEDGTTDLSLFRDAMKGLPEDAGIGIWDLATGRLVNWLSSDEFNVRAAEDIEFSPSGEVLAALGMANGSQVVPIWDPSTGKLVSRLTTEHTFGADLSFSPSGTEIAITYTGGEVDIIDVESGLIVSEFDGNNMRDSVFYSRDGKRLASGFCVWDVKSEQQIAKSDKYYIGDQFVFSADGARIYGIETREPPAAILCWDIATGKLTQPFAATMRDVEGGLNYLAISPSGEFIATGGMDATAKVWSVKTGQLLASFESRPRHMIRMGFTPGAGQDVRQVEFSPNGKLLLSSSLDGMLQIWDISKLDSAGGNRSVLRVNRLHLGEQLIDEEVNEPSPVEPVGQPVALKAELPVGTRVLVRTPENKWLAGYVLRTLDDGRVEVHPAGYSSKADLTVTRSRLLIP